MAVVRAAGGLLWREGKTGPRLAVIHRPHRQDWSLPKGKLAEGESWEAAALREVREETGCECRMASFAGAMSYVPRNNPKIVLYWHMELTREGKIESKFRDEIDEVAWLSPEEALKRLDYRGERMIVQRFPQGMNGGQARLASPRGGSAEVATLRAELLRRVTSIREEDADAPGLGPAFDLLAAAEDASAQGSLPEARRLLAAARRMALLALPDKERPLQARALLEQGETLAPWRRRAIRKLVGGDEPSVEALYLAAEIRDEASSEARSGPPWQWLALTGGLCALGGTAAAFLGNDPRALAATVLSGAAAGAAAGLLATRRRL